MTDRAREVAYPCPLGRPCGSCGSAETYAAQVMTLVPTGRAEIKRKPIDPCVAPLVAALNAAGIHTVASCCGHGVMPGSVALADGRELLIVGSTEAERIKLTGPDAEYLLPVTETKP